MHKQTIMGHLPMPHSLSGTQQAAERARRENVLSVKPEDLIQFLGPIWPFLICVLEIELRSLGLAAITSMPAEPSSWPFGT